MTGIFLPIARMYFAAGPGLILGLGGAVGLLVGMFGVGGGFLITPLLMTLGVPPTVAVASGSGQIVGTTVVGTFAHSKSGNVDFKLGLIILVGSLVGGSYGTLLVNHLRALGNFEVVVKGAYVVMLLFVGLFMFFESLQALGVLAKKKTKGPSTVMGWVNRLPARMYFEVSEISCSAVALLLLGLFIGVLAAMLGVGGGFVMLPVMIYVLGLPTHKAIGTSTFTLMLTSVNVTLAHSILTHSVDVILILLLVAGSSIGARLGAKIGRRLKAEQLRVIFSLIVLGVMVKILAEVLSAPSALIAVGG